MGFVKQGRKRRVGKEGRVGWMSLEEISFSGLRAFGSDFLQKAKGKRKEVSSTVFMLI